jgi:hypothetical protein
VGRLPTFDLSAGELPEAPQQSGAGASLHEPASVPLEHDDRAPDVGAGGRAGPDRDPARVRELSGRPAPRGNGTFGAPGRDRTTERLPQFHDSLVELARGRGGKEARERDGEATAHPGRADRAALERPAGRDPEAVRLEGDHGYPVQQARQCRRHVGTDAGELLPLLHTCGEAPVAFPDHATSRLVEVPRPCVVAGSLPDLQHVGLGCRGEPLDGREASNHLLEVGDRLGDASLLQEDLGEPGPVRVPSGPPGERPAVRAVPRHERAGERGRPGAGPATVHARRHRPPRQEPRS